MQSYIRECVYRVRAFTETHNRQERQVHGHLVHQYTLHHTYNTPTISTRYTFHIENSQDTHATRMKIYSTMKDIFHHEGRKRYKGTVCTCNVIDYVSSSDGRVLTQLHIRYVLYECIIGIYIESI